jgi:catechol 2,3-dioxygenase-like lactoylglutathione lyase family enzyme
VQLLNDIHHLAFVTGDLDRLTAFYLRVFEAEVTVELQEEGVRHAFIELGPHTVLHPFQIPGVAPPGPTPRFGRGHLDHFGLNAASVPAFRELRRRVMAEGAGDGVVTDQGSLLTFSFTDPDGGEHEVIWVKPNVPVGAGLSRVLWTIAEMD